MSKSPIPDDQPTCITPVGFVNVTPSSESVKKHARVFTILGITQLVLCGLSVTFAISIMIYAVKFQYYDDMEYYYSDTYAMFGDGIWLAVFFKASGILGVITGKKKTRCLNIASLVMTIFSALAAATMLGFEIAGAVHAASHYYLKSQVNWTVSCGIHSTLCVIAFTEFVVAIVHSAYCCGAQCCHETEQAGQRIVYGYVNPMQQPQTEVGTYVQTGPFIQPGQFLISPTIPQSDTKFQIQQPSNFPSSQLTQEPPAYPKNEKL